MADLSLDHVGAIVRNLDAGAERWRRLGFRLSPRSPQMGFDRATGRTEPWATSNHCAALHCGYLELIGVTQPSLPNPWQHFIDRFEGVHITALRCADADAAFADIAARCDGLQPPVDRRRQAPFRDGTREMRFRNIFSRDDAFPEGRFIVIGHQTPELIWQEQLMEHPNGAVALEDVQFFTTDPAATARRITALTGVEPSDAADGARRFQLPGVAAGAIGVGAGAIEVLSPHAFAARFVGAPAPASPSVAACTIAVRRVEAARHMIETAGIATAAHGDNAFSVAANDANGVLLVFREQTQPDAGLRRP